MNNSKAFTKASTKKRRPYKNRSKSPVNPTIIDINKNEILQKYPLYKNLKMVHLGLRPKRIPLKTVIRFTEEIYDKIGKLSRRQFQIIFREEHGFSDYVLNFFKDKLDSKAKGGLKKCEHTIINFMYSIEVYKEKSLLCLIFGQLLAEMYGSDFTIFVSELRNMIQETTRKNLLKHLDRRNTLSTFKIPFNKLKEIIETFLSKGTIERSTESFIALLIERYPSVKVDFCIEYAKFLHFTSELFIHKKQVDKGETRIIQNVDFVDDYDIFKTRNMLRTESDNEELKELCKFRLSELSDRFINVIMQDSGMENYHTVTRLKGLLVGLLKQKSFDMFCAIANEDKKGWFHVLLIENPSFEQKSEWEALITAWDLLCASGPTDLEITEFVKQILQNKTLVSEICKLIIYLTSKNI